MKQLGEKVLGLFFVEEGASAREAEPAPEPEPEPARVEEPSPAPRDDVKDVKKVMDLIASLPDGAPLEVKRAIVTASLEAFGIRIDRVLGAAAQSEKSLEAQARTIDREIAKQQELAKSVAHERARLRAVGAFFGKS